MRERMRIIGKGLPLFLVIMISFVVTFYFAMFGFDPHHDGFMFKTALDVSRGLTMYKDTYSQYGVLTILIQAAFIKILGEKVWAVKAATVVMYMISYIVAYLIYRKFLGRISAMLVCFLTLAMSPFYFWVFLPWSSVYSLAFLMISAYTIITYFERGGVQNAWLIAGSIAGVCCFLCRQPVGIVTVLAFYVSVFFLFAAKKVTFKGIGKPVLVYTLTWIILCIFVVLILLIKGALKDFWIQNIEYMFRFASSVGGGNENTLKRILDSLLGKPSNSLCYLILPFCCMFAFVYQLIRTAALKAELTKEHLAVIILSVYGIASWHQYYPVTCLRHLFWAAFPMFGIAVYIVKEMVRIILVKIKIHKWVCEWTAILLLGLLLFPELKYRYDCAETKTDMLYVYFNDDNYGYLNGLKLTEDEASFYSELHKTIKELENKYVGRPVTNITQDGYYACFYPMNYQPQFNNWGAANVYDDYNAKLAEFIAAEKPVLIGHVSSAYPGYYMYKAVNEIGILIPEDE